MFASATPEEIYLYSYHEAAHAVTGEHFKTGVVKRAILEPAEPDQRLASAGLESVARVDFRTGLLWHEWATTLWAGKWAEIQIREFDEVHIRGDLLDIYEWPGAFPQYFGITSAWAKRLVHRYRDKIELVAAELAARHHLTGREIRKLIA